MGLNLSRKHTILHQELPSLLGRKQKTGPVVPSHHEGFSAAEPGISATLSQLHPCQPAGFRLDDGSPLHLLEFQLILFYLTHSHSSNPSFHLDLSLCWCPEKMRLFRIYTSHLFTDDFLTSWIIILNPCNNLMGHYCYLHLTDEVTEAGGGKNHCQNHQLVYINIH